jgi:hypothetical protein
MAAIGFTRSIPDVLVPAAGHIPIDASLNTRYRVTLNAATNQLDNPSNLADGMSWIIEVIQDGAGSRGLTFGTKYEFGSDITSFTPSVAAGRHDMLGMYYNVNTDKVMIIAAVKGYA